MTTYNFTYATTFNPEYLTPYLNVKEFITDIKTRDNKYITISTTESLTETELSNLNTYIQNYSDFNQGIVDSTTIERCKAWGRDRLNEMEATNMDRKRAGLMGRIELENIMKETHDSFMYMSILEGALDTLHGILYGFPEETIGGTTFPAKAPFTFEHIWTEDIDKMKSDLNLFLGGL